MIFIIRAIAHKYGYLKFKSTPRAKNVKWKNTEFQLVVEKFKWNIKFT